MKSATGKSRQMAVAIALIALTSFYPIGAVLAVEEVTDISLTGVESVLDSATAGGGYEHGWKWVYHFTVPQTETLLTFLFSNFESGSNSISASNIRFYSAQASVASTTDSAIVMTAANASSTVMLLDGDAAGDVAGRQVDITVEVQVPDGTPGGTYTATYDVESDVPPDTKAPVIKLTGSDTITVVVGGEYLEEGATAMDNVDGDISLSIVVVGGDAVDTSVAETSYIIRYNVSDAAGNPAVEVTRTVTVSEIGPPPDLPPPDGEM